MDALVFDTSALLNFGHRGELAMLLKKLAGEYRLLTTPGAQAELIDPRRKAYYHAFLAEHFTVQPARGTGFDVTALARLTRTIDPGEISVMTLAIEINGLAVLDDKAARREARNFDLRLTGTVGLLHQAMQRKWLTETECLARIGKLCDAGFSLPRPAPKQSFADFFHSLESSP